MARSVLRDIRGGVRACWATIASLVETCKLNAVEPHAYLTATLRAIVNGHKQSQITDLLPWNYAAKV